ncbi:ribosomal protein L10 [Gloeothece citriformis PCC 7424]|uniref:Large ribosomal subunit protein uL10 n=1 Tax=Gloeothece citriformis (strain PCC 7424) TaxID=65393 RepID=RL10_GLOC7|nr:50S ribosomal protein L10 [Gloeothece citriformis]B7KIR6.1 RecName: Full=Large ribosomal subunit protein uL10; AltName: Full=50S ribosomal protein L10 [Gloeothece citriformis PCC 7424]ACK69472.1 ribosomal protein L10 [Gloeothece citriformis PCC 7424]
MGRTRENKEDVVADLKELLKESQLAVIIDYQGLSVAEITDLRRRIRPVGGTCKIAKNTLVRIAVDGDQNWQPMQEYLKGSSAVLLVQEDVGGIVKAYKSFQKDSKKTELRGGVMEGRSLTKDQVEALADLPSKEQLYAQIAGAINSITAKIAIGIKEVPSSVARGLQAYSEKEQGSES